MSRFSERIAWARSRFRFHHTQPSHIDTGVLTMGRGSYHVPRVIYHEGDTSQVRIGNFCSIAADVELIPGGNHRPDWVSMYPFRARYDLPGRAIDGHPASKGDIIIGHDVWIGRSARILSGVRIGNGGVVGAYSVVTRDVPPYWIVAGCPARAVKQRFPDETIAAIQRIAWWDWPEELLIERVDYISSDRIDEFVHRFDTEAGANTDHRARPQR